MSALHEQCRRLAEGSASQKRRAWKELIHENGLWGGCRQAAARVGGLAEIAAAYEDLRREWDRGPVVEATRVPMRTVEEQIATACRLLAAGAAASLLRGAAPDADLLERWARRAIGTDGDTPARLPTLWDREPEPRARQCFRGFAGTREEPPPGLGAAQDAVLALLRTGEEAVPPSYSRSLRVPILLARGQEGFLAWMRLERLEWGFGQFFQAAEAQLKPLQADVRQAVEEAWRYVLRARENPPEQDVRWCLVRLPEENGATLPIQGASLQAAVIAGLILLLEGWEYNPVCAVSATVGEDGDLGEVDGITNLGGAKLHAARQLAQEDSPAVVVVCPKNLPSEAERSEWEERGVEIRAAGAVTDVLPYVNTLFRRPRPELAPPTGVLSLTSPFYIERPSDVEVAAAIARRDSIVRIKGARQMGKTSLLARGLQQARNAGARVVLTDFQMLNSSQLASAEVLMPALAHWISKALELDVDLRETWDPYLGPSGNFREFMLEQVLGRLKEPVVWGLDEADRLFTCPYSSEVFGLFRSWHNERALYPHLPWSRLTLLISYATEAHLFIADLNQSPFNVGTTLTLQDFTPDQVAALNRRYGSPLLREAEIQRFHDLLGGHPYLSHRGLYEMVTGRLTLGELEGQADRDDGVFGEHLRRVLLLLGKELGLLEAMRGVLSGRPDLTPEAFYRLRTAGILTGEAARLTRPRCQVYTSYLARHLL